MKKSLWYLAASASVILIAAVFSVNVAAQQQWRPMGPQAPSLGSHYLQMANPLDPPAENWSDPTGPYKVIMEVDESLPNHTIYRPADLSAFPSEDKLPVIVMSGPGCDFDGDSYRPFWTEIASYGYLVIAVGLPVPEELRAALFFNKTEDVKDGLDWAFAVNRWKAGKYSGKIDTSNVVLMGQSCGGMIMTDLAADSRVSMLVYWNSGIGLMGNAGTSQSSGNYFLKTLKKPLAFFAGDTDMARQVSTASFEAVELAPAFFAVREIPGDAHGGTFRENNGGAYGTAAVAWLNWWTKGDKEAAGMFRGDPCGLANDPKWVEVRSKNLDPKPIFPRLNQDWPGYKRYEEENAKVTTAPEVVFMGNSITDFWPGAHADFFTRNNFTGRGIAGQTGSQMLVRFRQDVINLKPKAVVIMSGTNDICQDLADMSYNPDDNIVGSIISMSELALANGIKVIISSITPCERYMPIPQIDAGPYITNINERLKTYAEATEDVWYVDYFTPLANSKYGLDAGLSYDGIHPNTYCYALMEPIVTKVIREALGSKKEYYVTPLELARQLQVEQDKEHAERMKQMQNQGVRFQPKEIRK
jgi:lysophospholipase L1-like esterase/dienelactone hydrolase